jgi:hypothetical protein
VGNNEQPLDEQLSTARAEAASELAELRRVDERALTARSLVRKAILLQFEDDPNGSAEEIEAALQAALQKDDRYIEAYIELGRYYYAVLDDSRTGRIYFLKALGLLRSLCEETVRGLVDCVEEMSPHKDRAEFQKLYEDMILGKIEVTDRPDVP